MRGVALAVVTLSSTAACRPAPPAPTPALARVRVVMRRNITAAPLVLADAAGFFERRGIAVEFVELERNQDALPSLLAGRLDVLSSIVTPAFFNLAGRGEKLRFVAELGHFDPAGCTYAALVARRGLLTGGRLGRPPQGRPWRVAVRPGAMSDFVLGRALLRDGLATTDVQSAYVSSDAETLGLHNGSIDVAYSVGERVPKQLASGDVEQWYGAEALAPDFPYLALVFGPNLLVRDRELGVRFMAAYMEGIRRFHLGKTEANLAILEERMDLPREALLAACWVPIREVPVVASRALDEYQRWAADKGLLVRIVDSSEYWDGSVTRDAMSLLDAKPERAQ